jgi:hypothetical protein
MSYIEQLESYFHQGFLSMDVNIECKQNSIISYVKMLEEMLQERGIEVKKEEYDTSERYILAVDSTGKENKWIIDSEEEDYYRVRHMDAITHVAKNRIENGICNYKINIPKGSTRFSLTYLFDTGNINFLDIEKEEDDNDENQTLTKLTSEAQRLGLGY